MPERDFIPHRDRRDRSTAQIVVGIALALAAVVGLYLLVDAFAQWNRQQACLGSGRRCATPIETPR